MFHLYGLVIGIAVWVSVSLMEKKAREEHISDQDFWQIALRGAVGAFIGARLYHVITDFHLYQHALINAFKIWNGGLSIIGAVMGCITAVVLFPKKNTPLVKILDILVFGLPIGQAIGRWGNYFNQELYGLPTNLPWGIPIDAQHRIAPYLSATHFHPLFAYEMILTLLFGIGVWIRHPFKIGSGAYFVIYVLYYSLIRFCLDFLRIDKAMLGHTGMGVNQVVMLIIAIGAGGVLIWKRSRLFAV